MDWNEGKGYIGHEEQLFSVRTVTLGDGRGRGMRATQIATAAGLEATVLPDRCMDFYQVRMRGKNISFLSPVGLCSPAYYDPRGMEWFRAWPGGLLTTCGLDNIGSPCQADGEGRGLHGRIGNTPAENYCAGVCREDGAPAARLSGVMRDARMFGTRLSLAREICIPSCQPEIRFTDTICNEGGASAPFQLLYHFNLGYPLLSEHAVLELPSLGVRPRDDYARRHAGKWAEIWPPAPGFCEMCYYHTLQAQPGGFATVGLANPRERLRFTLRFDSTLLDNFVQWKMLGEGAYVLGLEPCNSTIEGRDAAERDGTLKVIEPGQEIRYQFTIRVEEMGESR